MPILLRFVFPPLRGVTVAEELEAMPGVTVAVRTTEFLNETLWKDDWRLQKLQNLEMDADERAFQKERFIEKI
ncbi:hypothetical protein Tco_1016437 [Tanacetum coccineum]|uniref:Uncharacterized protein n=1 Tax=Tanacetum coccineum TaxID=301880 RepID=A0ABQ5FR26_9ASTR